MSMIVDASSCSPACRDQCSVHHDVLYPPAPGYRMIHCARHSAKNGAVSVTAHARGLAGGLFWTKGWTGYQVHYHDNVVSR